MAFLILGVLVLIALGVGFGKFDPVLELAIPVFSIIGKILVVVLLIAIILLVLFLLVGVLSIFQTIHSWIYPFYYKHGWTGIGGAILAIILFLSVPPWIWFYLLRR